MNKVYFFGTGFCAKRFVRRAIISMKMSMDFQIMGFLDNDKDKIGTLFEGHMVYAPDMLRKQSCDLVLLFLMDPRQYEIVFQQLSKLIPSERIYPYDYFLKQMLQNNYGDSEDKEIKDTLEFLSDHNVSVFNQFIKEDVTYDEVKWDRDVNLPYVDFLTVEGKVTPMYYPIEFYNKQFVKKGKDYYVPGLMWEQSVGSPHLYVSRNHKVLDGDCIIDAGVCEGNFALKYIDIASHIYLFENAPIWQKPLRCTFRAFENKVTIIDKAVSNKTSNDTCRIDDVVLNSKVDFVKMDIEGAEVSAICGAERTFRENDLRASICSYHRNGDEKKIRLLLEKYGYCTSVSDGYMLFLFSDDTWEIGDLRRGIVYGNK